MSYLNYSKQEPLLPPLPLSDFAVLPDHSLSLISGATGTGHMSFWTSVAKTAVRDGKWVAWITSRGPGQAPRVRRNQDCKGHLVTIGLPFSEGAESASAADHSCRLLHELMSSGLFDLIGCDPGNSPLRFHQLRSLKATAELTGTTLAFVTSDPPPQGSSASVYSLILKFEQRRILSLRSSDAEPALPMSIFLNQFSRSYRHDEQRTASKNDAAVSIAGELTSAPRPVPETTKTILQRRRQVRHAPIDAVSC